MHWLCTDTAILTHVFPCISLRCFALVPTQQIWVTPLSESVLLLLDYRQDSSPPSLSFALLGYLRATNLTLPFLSSSCEPHATSSLPFLRYENSHFPTSALLPYYIISILGQILILLADKCNFPFPALHFFNVGALRTSSFSHTILYSACPDDLCLGSYRSRISPNTYSYASTVIQPLTAPLIYGRDYLHSW